MARAVLLLAVAAVAAGAAIPAGVPLPTSPLLERLLAPVPVDAFMREYYGQQVRAAGAAAARGLGCAAAGGLWCGPAPLCRRGATWLLHMYQLHNLRFGSARGLE